MVRWFGLNTQQQQRRRSGEKLSKQNIENHWAPERNLKNVQTDFPGIFCVICRYILYMLTLVFQQHRHLAQQNLLRKWNKRNIFGDSMDNDRHAHRLTNTKCETSDARLRQNFHIITEPGRTPDQSWRRFCPNLICVIIIIVTYYRHAYTHTQTQPAENRRRPTISTMHKYQRNAKVLLLRDGQIWKIRNE